MKGAIWHPYCGPAPDPAGGWRSGIRSVAGPAASGRQLRCGAVVRPMSARRGAATAALVLFVVLYVSPLCALGSALFLARVTHHVLLAVALAPLLVIGFGLQQRRLLGVARGVDCVAGRDFLGVALAAALRRCVVERPRSSGRCRRASRPPRSGFWVKAMRASPLAAIAALLATMVQMGVLGALITFAPNALYAPHWSTTAAWGLAPLEDQQLAGLVMWAPAAAAYLLAALAIGWRAIGRQPGAMIAADPPLGQAPSASAAATRRSGSPSTG